MSLGFLCSWRYHQGTAEGPEEDWRWNGEDAVQSQEPKELSDQVVQEWKGDYLP